MTTDSSWDPTRWGEGQQLECGDEVQTPRSSAHNAVDRSLQNSALDSYPQTWNAQSRIDVDQTAQKLPSLTEPHADASSYQSRLHGRHSPSPSGKYGFEKLPRLPGPASAWHQSLRYDNDDRRNERRITDAPLTLHIPNSQDSLRTAPGYAVASSDVHSSASHSAWSQNATSLPSFATLQEHAGRRNDLDDDDVASLSSPLPCHLCTKLVARVKEVANAVAELDEEVQLSCNRSLKRASNFSSVSPMSAVNWILDTLRSAKEDLRASRAISASYGYQQASSSLSGVPSRNMSPPSGLKRTAERWDQDELPVPKRPRSGPSPEEVLEQRSAMATDHRRASIDFITRDHFQRPGLSPPASDSVPGSAYPRTSSPGRTHRTLPSPSSITYPNSAAPSLTHPSAQTTGSPTSSSQREASVHTSSATSAHIAELQHQVTLKSLALQTLESEYTSLLQKIQRLNIKTQTLERKSNVADQEVNELTTKNEDLNQQVQSLQEQLDGSEKRREKERDDYGTEKHQWMQMLDQGRRLQAKLEEDKKNLSQEITSLKSAMTRLQKDRELKPPSVWNGSEMAQVQQTLGSNQDSIGTENSSALPAGDQAALKAKVEILRRSLEEARRHNQVLDERASEVVERSSHLGSIIDRALDDEGPSVQETPSNNNRGQQTSFIQLSPSESRSPTENSRNERAKPSDKPRVSIPPSEVAINSVRPIIASPKERNFQGQLYISSSEDLMRTLGPKSVASAAAQYTSPHMANTNSAHNESSPFKSSAQGRQLTSGVNVWSTLPYGQPGESNSPVSLGSFRPLTHGTLPRQPEFKSRSGDASPDGMLDDSSSTSTKSANGQSPGSSWAGDGQFGTDITPVSTLPTPGSAASLKQSQSYPFERRYSLENAGSMPPPPRPTVQIADLDSTRG